jgi:H+/Cl- antiporter ClcA
LIFCLPLTGFALGAVLERVGKPVQAGSNLIIDTLHDGGPELPWRLAPGVLVGTVLTHLFGGSAGREGAAVQMGAGLADALAHRLACTRPLRQHFLAAGVAGGFGSVFGTPIAGALFGLEFVVLGQIDYAALLPAVVAAVVGDMVTRSLGVVHTPYPTAAPLPLTPGMLLRWAAFAAAIALTGAVFIELTRWLKACLAICAPRLRWRMAAGGLAVVVLWQLAGTSAYLGLGVPGILRAFTDPTQPPQTFALKLVFTAVTLGSGFLGGEVTPLFFMGAALGNTLAGLLGLPLDLAAGLGMAGLFASAANTPLALTVMAVELLGREALPHAAIVCVLAYLLAGNRSIYSAQRLRRDKAGQNLTQARALRDGSG